MYRFVNLFLFAETGDGAYLDFPFLLLKIWIYSASEDALSPDFRNLGLPSIVGRLVYLISVSHFL